MTYFLEITQTIGIIAILFILYLIFELNKKSAKLKVKEKMVSFHRVIWQKVILKKNLYRLLSKDVNLEEKPITLEERFAVIMVVNNMSYVFSAEKDGLIN